MRQIHQQVIGQGGCALVSLMPVLATGYLLSSPQFLLWSVMLALTGFVVSSILRSVHPPRVIVAACVICMTCIGMLTYLRTTILWDALLSPTPRRYLLSVGTSEGYIVLIHLIIIFHVCRTFSLLTHHDLVLSIVPGLSVMILIAVFPMGVTVIPFFVPFALGVMMLLMFWQWSEIERSHELLTDALHRRHSLILNLRALAAIMVMSVMFSGGLMFVFREHGNRPRIFDRIGIALAQRIAQQLYELARIPYITPTTSLSLDGEPFPLTRRELFEVYARQPAYWRGVTLDEYTGRMWVRSRTLGNERYELRSGRVTIPSHDVALHGGSANEELLHTIKVLEPHVGIVFGAYEITSISIVTPDGISHPLAVRVDEDSSVRVSGVLRRGTEYTLVSRLKAAPGSVLATPTSINMRTSENLPQKVRSRYLRLPTLPPRLVQLGKEFSQRKASPLATVEAIRQYVSDRLTYSPDPPPLPPEADAVDFTLFESREGYCTHYASAVTVLCRLAGISSRLVTGFAPGRYDAEEGKFHVREMDAHAWSEVFLPQYGWLAVDASPAVDLNDVARRMRDSHRNGVLVKAVLQHLLARVGTENLWILIGALIGLTLSILIWIFSRTRREAGQDSRQILLCLPGDKVICQSYQRMCRLLARRYRMKLPTETPHEYLAAVEDWLGLRYPIVAEITSAYVIAIYGAPTAPRPTRARLSSLLRLVKTSIRKQHSVSPASARWEGTWKDHRAKRDPTL